MEQNLAIGVLQSLASVPRLDIYRLLVRAGPDGLVAGEIGQQLDLPATNLSFHLKALTQAGLLSVTAEGRYQRYRANMAVVLDLIDYLTEECCAGRPQDCLPPVSQNACVDAANTRRRSRPT